MWEPVSDLWEAYKAGYLKAQPDADVDDVIWYAYGEWLTDQLERMNER